MKFLRGLAREQPGSAHTGAPFRVEGIARAGHGPLNGVKFKNHWRTIEPDVFERPSKLLATRKQIVRRAGWQIDLEISVCLHDVVDDLCVWIFRRRGPNREAEFAAGFEDTESFGASALRVRHMKQSEVGQDAIESDVG